MAAKKTTAKKAPAKKAEKKVTAKKDNKLAGLYNRDVSLLFAITIEALILILAYLIIMSHA